MNILQLDEGLERYCLDMSSAVDSIVEQLTLIVKNEFSHEFGSDFTLFVERKERRYIGRSGDAYFNVYVSCSRETFESMRSRKLMLIRFWIYHRLAVETVEFLISEKKVALEWNDLVEKGNGITVGRNELCKQES